MSGWSVRGVMPTPNNIMVAFLCGLASRRYAQRHLHLSDEQFERLVRDLIRFNPPQPYRERLPWRSSHERRLSRKVQRAA